MTTSAIPRPPQPSRQAAPPPPPSRVRPLAPADPFGDPRLARLAARSTAHRVELGVAAGAPIPPPPRAHNGTGSPGRRHAAKGSRAAALALSVGTTLGLAWWFHGQQAQIALTAGTSAASDGLSPTAAPSSSVPESQDATATASAVASASSSATSATGLADGTYVGEAVVNRWGPVQVQIAVSGGLITDVEPLQAPSGDGKSVVINSQALPLLVQETLATQSAEVDTISGATYTSSSYRESLQTAIDEARAQAVAG